MPIYKQTTEITKIDDVWANIDRDIVEVYFGDKNIFTVWGEYTGTLPITINANGDALIDYRIYGASGGVCEQTENLFDPNAKNVDNGYIAQSVIGYPDGNISSLDWAYVTEYIPVDSNTNYVMFMNLYRTTTVDWARGLVFYDENKDFISAIRGCTSLHGATYENPKNGIISFTTPENCKYIRTNVDTLVTMLMLVAASTPPPTYIPYGYKLPMTVSDGNTAQTVPVYIGENQLDAIGKYIDYVDYDAQKIIRRIAKIELDGSETWFTYQNAFYIGVPNYIRSVWGTCAGFSRSSHYTPSLDAYEIGTYCLGGLIQHQSTRWNGNIVINAGMTKTEFIAYLASQAAVGTPVTFWYVVEIPVEEDPPVSFPDIPTIKGETIIDYDGEPKPSQVYVKYRKQYS